MTMYAKTGDNSVCIIKSKTFDACKPRHPTWCGHDALTSRIIEGVPKSHDVCTACCVKKAASQ